MSRSFLVLINNAVLLVIIFLFLQIPSVTGGKLNRYIKHYEPLNYDVNPLHNQHVRMKRSLNDGHIKLKFNSHGRTFNMVLSPDSRTFNQHSSLAWFNGKVDEDLDLTHLYSGYIKGQPNSYVHGSIIDGIFSGRIDLQDETYYIEKSMFYFKKKPTFHSIVYVDKDVVDNPTDDDDEEDDDEDKNNEGGNDGDDAYIRLKRSIQMDNNIPNNIKRGNHNHHPHRHHQHADCGMSHRNVHEWMESVQKSAVPVVPPSTSHEQKMENRNFIDYKNKYSFEANNQHYNNHKLQRMKRQANKENRQCSLYLQSDPTLWSYFNRTIMGDSKTKAEITSLFASHVDALNSIYKNTVFIHNNMGPYTGFNFVVHRIQINTTSMCGTTGTNPNSGFCKNNLDASNLLNEQSLTNHSDYCLAFTFAYRQFTHGTIGLAWVAQAGTSGGICEKYKQFAEGTQLIYKSLNTGIVTLCNYNNRVPVRVSQITFSHEVGHNFGSLHDSGQCVPLLSDPTNKKGNYLMFASATSGLQENNNKFSVCSIINITRILDQILSISDPNINCFQKNEGAFCGNGIVEWDPTTNTTEECDCGFENDCQDICCHPRTITDSSPDASKACKLKINATCSKSQGPCCTETCDYIPASKNQTCNRQTDCSYTSFCDGKQVKCPAPMKKPDGNACNENTQMCSNGECTMSICNKINWTVCSSKAPPGDKTFDRGLLCFVSCLNPQTNLCISTGNKDQLQQPANKPLSDLVSNLTSTSSVFGIRLPAGTPCENFLGYCDVFFKCRPVNEDGPLVQLTKLLINEKTISNIRQWVTEYWWVVLLSAVGVIVFMALFIKLCAVHTPSSNPKLKKARQLSLRRRRPQGDMKMGVSSISASHHDVLRSGPSGEGGRSGADGRSKRSSGRSKSQTVIV